MINKIQSPSAQNSVAGDLGVKKIAMIDNFSNDIVPIINDDAPDVSHGEVVKRLLKEGLPTAEIECFPVRFDSDNVIPPEESTNALLGVLSQINKGEKFDAVNFSIGKPISYTELSKELGVDITPQNLAQNKALIKQFIFSKKDDIEAPYFKSKIETIEKIISKGVPVYVPAGNFENESFNVYSLANGVKTVSALDADGQKELSCADNSTVTNWAQGVFSIHKLKDSNGQVGYDYTEDGTIDLYKDTNPLSIDQIPAEEIWGTSFATPKAIVNDLKAKNIVK